MVVDTEYSFGAEAVTSSETKIRQNESHVATSKSKSRLYKRSVFVQGGVIADI